MTGHAVSTDKVVIHAVGDVGPRRVEYGELPESLFAMVHQKIKEADIAFCQLERSLSTRGCLQYRDHNTWYGRVHPDNVKALVAAGFQVASNASNHGFDYGPDALLDTIDILRRNHIQVIGVGKDVAEARQPAVFERNGIKVGFLAYCSILPVEYEAREGKPGLAPIHISTHYEPQEYQAGTPPKVITIPVEAEAAAMEQDIRQLRRQVDIVIVSMHWGIHLIPGVLAMYQPALGHRAIDAGADLVIGHHAHLIKGIEMYKGKAIFYSLGNFAQETPLQMKPPSGMLDRAATNTYLKFEHEPGWERYKLAADSRYTMMARCVASKQGIGKVSFLPGMVNRRAEPEFLSRTDPRFDEVLEYMLPWCRELGTTLTGEGDEIVVTGTTSQPEH
ncbi:MAG: CapA family protein [Chloroflexi bacterium]|nr:CapA family protein [Chloroflexota bacterium]